MTRTGFVITVPEDFVDKFIGMMKNVNVLNYREDGPVIIVEKVFSRDDTIAASPKGSDDES